MQERSNSQTKYPIISNFEIKGNSSNTIYKFFQPDVEYVTKLNFYIPNSNVDTLYNLKKTTVLDDHSEQNKTIQKFKTKLPKLASDSNQKKSSSKNRYLQMHRLENISHEAKNEECRAELEEKLKENKVEFKKLYSHLAVCKKEIENLEIEIEFFNNFAKYSGQGSKYKLMRRASLNNGVGYDKMMKMKKILDLEMEKRDHLILSKRKELEKKEESITQLRLNIETIEGRSRKINEDLRNVKNSLLVHYHKLLVEGKDTRTEGIAWLIKAIWNLGHEVLPSYLPPFLDEKSIKYIFKYASRDIDLNKIKKKIDDVHLITRAKREKKLEEFEILKKQNEVKNLNELGSTHLTFQTGLGATGEHIFDKLKLYDETNSEIDSDIIKYLIEKYKRENNVYDEALSIKKIESIMKNKNALGEDAIKYIKSVQDLESQLKSVQSSMQIIKREEIDRINKEFYTNDYERRFRVSLDVIISAIVGEDNTMNEIGRLFRDQKAYYKKLENLRSFNILSNVGKNKINLSTSQNNTTAYRYTDPNIFNIL